MVRILTYPLVLQHSLLMDGCTAICKGIGDYQIDILISCLYKLGAEQN